MGMNDWSIWSIHLPVHHDEFIKNAAVMAVVMISVTSGPGPEGNASHIFRGDSWYFGNAGETGWLEMACTRAPKG